jgi:hypothetical protein
MKKFDKIGYGLIVGIILPVFGFLLGYYVKFYPRPLGTYWNYMANATVYQTEILTFSLVPNLFLFYFLFFRWKLDEATKGLVFVSILYVILVVSLSYL